jgi:hypothetical protein
MKQWSISCWQDIEAMKRLMLHHIASSLYHFISSVAQLCF